MANAIYKDGYWALNETTGRYEEKFTTGEPQEVASDSNVKANSVYAVSTVDKIQNGYDFESTDKGTYNEDKKQVELKLAENGNVINMTFVKHADKNSLNPAKVVVKHNYYLTEKKIVDGKLVTEVPETPVTVEEKYNDYYVGEIFTPSQQLVKDGITYNADSLNAGKLKAYKLETGTLEVVLEYHQIKEPAATSVTVNHIYRTYDKEYVEVLDDEGNVIDSKVQDVVKEDGRKTETIDKITIGDLEEKLYEGFVYTADKNGSYNGKGYIFNAEDSTTDAQLVLSADEDENEINLYYDAKEDNRTSADISVKHTYITKLTTVENGKVVTKDVTDYTGTVDSETDFYAGKAGDSFGITLHDSYGGNSYSVKSANVPESVTLKPGTNATIEIVYEREYSDLKATVLNVAHRYINKVMSVLNGVAGYYGTEEAETVAVVTDFTVDGGKTLPENVYVGEKYTVDLRTVHEGTTYTPDNANPGQEITLADKEVGNSLEYKYSVNTPLPTTTVIVNHHYSHKTINSVGEASTTTDDKTIPAITKYVGESAKVSANEAGYTFSNVTVTGLDEGAYTKDAQNDIIMTVSNAAVVVDYYYTKKTDNSVGATWKVNHYYRTLDWNDSTDKEYTLDTVVSQAGSSYATKTLTGVPNLKANDEGNSTYELDKATATSAFNGENYTITLAEGENEINFYYTQKIDSRKDTVVKVIHNYYKHDVSGLVPDSKTETEEMLPGVLAGSYEEVFKGKAEKAWVGNKFTAEKRCEYGEGENALVYTFKDASPENGTIAYLQLADTGNPNVIVLNYVYEYDASENVTMKINHVYRTYDSYTNKTTEEIDDVNTKFGNDDYGTWNKEEKQFTAKEIAKTGFERKTSDEGMTVYYNAGENEMTVIYEKTVSSKPGGGGKTDRPKNPTESEKGPDTDVNIPEEDVPLGDGTVIITDEEVPLAGIPESNEEQIIEDEKTPLGNLPKTGGIGAAGFLAAGAAIMGVGALMRRREEEK